YIVKPFEREELHARVQVGFRMLELQAALADRVRELEEALARVKQLQGLLPICSYCKKVRDDQNYWQQVETYIEGHSDAQFTHGICPDCRQKFVEPELDRLRKIREARGCQARSPRGSAAAARLRRAAISISAGSPPSPRSRSGSTTTRARWGFARCAS